MNAESVHGLKLRLWRLPAGKRAEYMSELDAALVLPAGDEQDAALAKLATRASRAEALSERNRKRKEAAHNEAVDRLRKDLGF